MTSVCVFPLKRTEVRNCSMLRAMSIFSVACVVVVAFTVGNADAGGQVVKPFRCLRPFDALDKFQASSMRSKDNCRFDYVTIVSAAARVDCFGRDHHVAEKSDSTESSDGCYATLNVTMRIDRALEPGDELPRFTFELRAVNHSTVAYKGFDQMGYDVCCAFLNSSGAECRWRRRESLESSQQRSQTTLAEYCALYDPQRVGSIVAGSVRKPLHRLVVGEWEVKWNVFRNRESVGKLVTSVELKDSDVAIAASATKPATEEGATAGGVAPYVAPSDTTAAPADDTTAQEM